VTAYQDLEACSLHPQHTGDLLKARPVWGTFIGGRFVDPAGSATFDVLEAATGRKMSSVVAATEADVDKAVMNARSAYESRWRDTSPPEPTSGSLATRNSSSASVTTRNWGSRRARPSCGRAMFPPTHIWQMASSSPPASSVTSRLG
jgi:Aldehyde dehydrogenase family